MPPYVLWPTVVGAAFLIAGFLLGGRRLAAAPGMDKLIVAGPLLVAPALAAFGMEHFVVAQFIAQGVPLWIPWHLFWTYFVGAALIAASLSFVAAKCVRWSSLALAVMLFLFVLLIHLHEVIAEPKDRILWVVMLRDLAFAGGALAFSEAWAEGLDSPLITVGRLWVAVPLLFFAVEHFLHPGSAPGVPLEKVTPDWVPLRLVWGYLTGVILLAAGAALLVNRWSRVAAVSVGVVMTLLTVFLYLPIWIHAVGGPAQIEGLNYFADTLMFGGTTLLLAAALPKGPAILTTE